MIARYAAQRRQRYEPQTAYPHHVAGLLHVYRREEIAPLIARVDAMPTRTGHGSHASLDTMIASYEQTLIAYGEDVARVEEELVAFVQHVRELGDAVRRADRYTYSIFDTRRSVLSRLALPSDIVGVHDAMRSYVAQRFDEAYHQVMSDGSPTGLRQR